LEIIVQARRSHIILQGLSSLIEDILESLQKHQGFAAPEAKIHALNHLPDFSFL